MQKLNETERHDSMRGWFAYEVYNHMVDNKDIFVVVGDLGYGMFDKIKRDFPDRFINTGAAEQSMIGVGVGLAEMGKIPFVYSITPFLLYRGFETIRNYINREKVPVKLIGSGRDKDYLHDGFSHWAEEDRHIMGNFKNIWCKWPETKEELPNLVGEMVTNKEPYYCNLRR